MNEQEIQNFLNQTNYDIREIGNTPRWIDQKCTPDVLWSIADFVLNYVEEKGENAVFSPKDIWMSDYAKEIVKDEFSKPDTDSDNAQNEYDKFFGQPLNLFCFAKILEDTSRTRKHLFKVANIDLLKYIARNSSCSYKFLCIYIEKVLKDSGLFNKFADFFEYQNQIYYKKVKDSFENFCFTYTNIRNTRECGRIFTKVINPLACKYVKQGTKAGRISDNIIPKQELMYNRDNFRDVYRDKPKNVSRKEWMAQQSVQINNGYLEHQLAAARRQLREFNDYYFNSESELTRYIENQTDTERATQIHHIFPKSSYPEIMAYLENLIALTPNQHYEYVHPNNRTGDIDLEGQRDCLIAKTCCIRNNLESRTQEHIYEFNRLLEVLAIGWENDEVLEIADNDYHDIIQSINAHYINMI